jgi:hypothetical protein
MLDAILVSGGMATGAGAFIQPSQQAISPMSSRAQPTDSTSVTQIDAPQRRDRVVDSGAGAG